MESDTTQAACPTRSSSGQIRKLTTTSPLRKGSPHTEHADFPTTDIPSFSNGAEPNMRSVAVPVP